MTTDDIYTTLLTFGRARILERFRPDCCIASTRIAIEVLRRFGIRAKPAPCQVYIATLPLFERLQKQSFTGKFQPGEHSVGIGYGVPAGTRPGFDGHLVAVTDDSLIDLSLDQASRPHKGIVLLPQRIPFSGFPLSGTIGQCVVCYTQLNNYDYIQAPDWCKRPELFDEIADEIVSEIKCPSQFQNA